MLKFTFKVSTKRYKWVLLFRSFYVYYILPWSLIVEMPYLRNIIILNLWVFVISLTTLMYEIIMNNISKHITIFYYLTVLNATLWLFKLIFSTPTSLILSTTKFISQHWILRSLLSEELQWLFIWYIIQ